MIFQLNLHSPPVVFYLFFCDQDRSLFADDQTEQGNGPAILVPSVIRLNPIWKQEVLVAGVQCFLPLTAVHPSLLRLPPSLPRRMMLLMVLAVLRKLLRNNLQMLVRTC